jgi:hypothetical protein
MTDGSKGAGMANGDTNLEALIGEWSMEAIFPFDPPIVGRGRVSFERLSGGRARRRS